jgi:hypothetical protein
METFTLMIWTWALWATNEIRRPGFSEIECKLQAAEVMWPKKAKCEAEATPPPKAKPPPVICPFAPPCWQDGKPIVGALG